MVTDASRWFESIPPALIQFVFITVFSLLIGLSQRHQHNAGDISMLFGTDRTFTFIGLLGFILYKVDSPQHFLYIGGGLVLSVFLGIFYYNKIRDQHDYGITSILTGLVTYTLTPLLITQPRWLFLLVVVTILIFTELKKSLTTLTTRFDKEEFITLGKFLFIAGVVLPIVPDEPFYPGISLTPYKIWLGVVVVSSVSYLSYLLQKFVFRKSGLIISSILGGLYSSTATTIILSRKSKENPGQEGFYAGGILIAISMMFFRIGILVAVFNGLIFRQLAFWLAMLFGISLLMAFITIRISAPAKHRTKTGKFSSDKNPLEFRIALLFALVYMVFFLLTQFTIEYFGQTGLNLLALLSGLTDVDPFLLTLLQGKFAIEPSLISAATLLVMLSNNIAKGAYALSFGNRVLSGKLWPGLTGLVLANLAFYLIAWYS